MGFAHEDATGLISVYGQQPGQFHSAANEVPSIICLFSQSSRIVHRFATHARWLHCFCSILSGHPGPKETTAVPSCHCAPGRACQAVASQGLQFPSFGSAVLCFWTARVTTESCFSTAQEHPLNYGSASPTQHPQVCGSWWAPTSVSNGGEGHCQHHLACPLFVVAFGGKGDRQIRYTLPHLDVLRCHPQPVQQQRLE